MLDPIGQQMGNYHLLQVLGQGSYARVYLGTHVHLGTKAAIKILDTRLSREDIKRFRVEARMIARLKHPHIVRVLDFDVQDGTPFLVLEYASNGTLRQRHPRGRQLPARLILSYVQQVTGALQYAHDQGLVHRDVKPENMLMDEDQALLLSDFGIAVAAVGSRNEYVQNVAGTVAYMAPEQLQGKPCPASDQYALGVVVYEWLCGEPPFHGPFTELLSQHMLTPPPLLRTKIPTITPLIEEAVLTALEKDPHQRFSSIRAFGQAFEHASQGTTTLRSHPVKTAPAGRLPASAPSPGEVPPITQLPQPERQMQPTLVAGPSAPPVLLEDTLRMGVVSQPSGRGVSRRIFLIGGACLALAAGGIVGYLLSHRSPTHPNTLSPPPKAGTTIVTYTGHHGTVYALDWSPDGQRIASASKDNTVQVWDSRTGGSPFTYRGHAGWVDAVAWSPDGERIVSGSSTSFDAQVWVATSGRQVYPPLMLGGVEGIAWSPDGSAIAAASDDGHVYVWNANQGTLFFSYLGHSGRVLAVAWSPDGSRVASASVDNTIQVWNPYQNGVPLIFHGHTNGVNTVDWSPDGGHIASGSSDGTVRVWDANTTTQVLKYEGHKGQVVEGLAWSPDGKRIVSAGMDTTAQVWDPLNGNRYVVYRVHKKTVRAVAWSPDSQKVASGSDDTTVKVWQAR